MSTRNASSSRSSKSSSRHNDSHKKDRKDEVTDEDSENEDVEDQDSEESSDDTRKKSKHKEKEKDHKPRPKVVISPDIGQIINRILCTACGKQLNHTNPGAVRQHPWLKVVTCKKCYRFLKSGPFTRDGDGIDEQCRWCGDGGRIYGCDYCHNCFCRSCIKRNLGRSEASKFESDDNSKWHCYICKPKKIHKLRDDCQQIIAYIEREQEKEKERERKAKLKEQMKKDRETKEKEEREKSVQREKSEDRERSNNRDKSKEREGSHDKSLKKTLPPPKAKINPVVVVDDSPQKKPAEPSKPSMIDIRKDTKFDMKNVQKFGSAVKQVVVMPRGPQQVTYPYKPVTQSNIQPRPVTTPQVTQSQRWRIEAMLGGSSSARNGTNLPPNNLSALLNTVFPNNAESLIERMMSITQSLTLVLNSVKTDLAIAKLSQPNMYNAKSSASLTLKTGMTDFFAKMRDVYNVQFTTNAGVIEIDGSSDDAVVAKSSTPIKSNTKPVVKEDPNISMIPISLDDSDTGELKDVKKEIKVEGTIQNGDEPLVVSDDEVDDKAASDKQKGQDNSDKKEDEKVAEDGNDDNMEVDENGKEDLGEDEQDEDEGEEIKKKEDDGKETEKSGKSKDSKKENKGDCDDDTEDLKNGASVSSLNGGLDNSENTAAELELLKEMADEINEKSAMESEEPRRSRRQKHEVETEEGEEGDDEKSAKKSSKHSSSKKHTKGTHEKIDIEEEDEESDKKSRGKHHQKANKSKVDTDEENEDEESENKKTKSKDHSKHRHNKKEEDVEDEEVRRSSRNKLKEDADDDASVEKDDAHKRSSKKKSKDESKEEEKDEKESDVSRRSSRKKNKDDADEETSIEKEEKASRSGKKKPKEEADEDEKADESGKRSSKKKLKDDAVKKESTEESSSKRKGKNDKKEEKSTLSVSLNNESSGSESDDSDSSEGSPDEFGKRKKKRKTRQKDTKAEKPEKEKHKKITLKITKEKMNRKKEDKDEDDAVHSDSSNFDPELEKEINSLAKETRMTRRAKKDGQDTSKATKKSDKSKKEKEAGASKGKKTSDEEETLFSDSDEDDDDGQPDNDDEDEDDEDNEDEEDEDEEDEDENGDNDLDTDDPTPSQLQKLKKASKEAEEEGSDFELMEVDSADSSDPEVSFPKLGASPAKGTSKKGKSLVTESEDSDFVTKKKNKGKKKVKDALLDAKLSGSESEEEKKGKKGKGRKRKKKETESEPDEYDEVYSDGEKKKGKRKRIKKVSSSEEEGTKEPGEDDDMSGSDDGQGGYLKRRKIRKVMKNKKLGDETKQARRLEEERRKRIEERQKEYNSYVEVEGGEVDEDLPEGTEQELAEDPNSDSISKILGSPRKVPVTSRCILELDKDKKPLIEIDRTLVRKLKPHQVEAVRFVFNCLIENVERLKTEEGAGCILAHCMGLGKTLSIISFVHTVLRYCKLTNLKHALVVSPLNTVLNWVNEFEVWLGDVDFEIDVYELSRVKQNFERAQMLKEWMEGGAGVMIIGYDMYRNLVNGSHCKNKKQKKIFYEALVEPGPDLVICDEGHILKNDQTALAKAMNKVKTRRRVVLTGTPLQNNLVEYHCMASFVKPNLMGTRKEFSNRFANPITNGQCKDSTPQDVRLMKRRAHILHEMLAGCVQRKDYSALTKYLPPKLEYVISVRLSPVQMTLYEKYLELVGLRQPSKSDNKADTKPNAEALKGAKLFRDYQSLMRIWTHPWVMKLDEIRQENKRTYDDSEDSFVDDNTDEEDSFISGSSTPSQSESESETKKKKSTKGKGSRRSRRGRGSSSGSNTEDEKKDDDKNEVVKKWTSRRRGNEEGAGSSWMEDWGYNAEIPKGVSQEWWAEYVKEEDETKLELSGKVILLFEVLRMCEDIGDKVLVFSQSLLSLDIIEDFLAKVDEDFSNRTTNVDGADGTKEGGSTDGDKTDAKKDVKKGKDDKGDDLVNGEKKEGEEEKKEEKYPEYGQTWVKGADYFRMDGSTNSVQRKTFQDLFNDPENYRARLFLISTKAGSLGINLVAANRVIIFDASWNPSHDIQSIFRVYRFGQTKPVYVYRFLAQGTMEEKIYERQVTKQSLSQRVVDEHQIERHFTNADLTELYHFTPDRLDDPDRKEKPLPMLPKDHMLAELMTSKKEWIMTFHEHDSLLENKPEQDLTEDEKKAAWEDYENEKKGVGRAMYGGMASMYQNPNMDLANLMVHGQANLGQAAVLQIIQDLKSRFPHLPPQLFQQRVEAVMRQVLTQQIMRQSEMQKMQIDQQKANELYRLNQLKQQIQRQQAMISNQQRGLGLNNYGGSGMIGMPNVANQSMYNMGASGGASSSQSYIANQLASNSLLQQNYQNKPGGSSNTGGQGSGGGASKS